jgi:hypothetical protein
MFRERCGCGNTVIHSRTLRGWPFPSKGRQDLRPDLRAAGGSFKRGQPGLKPTEDGRAAASGRFKRGEARLDRAKMVAGAKTESKGHDTGDRERERNQQAKCE